MSSTVASPANAATYEVTVATDNVDAPEPGSLCAAVEAAVSPQG